MTSYPKADLIPDITEANAPFWTGLNEGRLVLQHCDACQSWQHSSESFCFACGSFQMSWQQASGTGTVHTFIIVHQRFHPAFADDLPYNVSVIELDEGPRLVTNLVDIANEDIRIGMRVRLAPRLASETQHQPTFAPAD